MKILVTGGAGYIGSHTTLELLNAGHDVVVVDNLSNASLEALNRVEKITGKSIKFYQVDLRDTENLSHVFKVENVDAVIHFAALKAVGESVEKPLLYYQNNITGTLNLCEVMESHNVRNIIFSSSATVYGDPDVVPITESAPLSTTNPYGSTKLMMEQILQDLHVANDQWNVVILRYFNPIGAHESGLIGEDPAGIPNNLVPYITQVAVGKLKELAVFGDDYDTPDGSGVRDYIHVVDLARGHVDALQKLNPGDGVSIYNLGTGNGYSVLEMVEAFSEVIGQPIPYRIQQRRAGDIAVCYADPSKVEKELGWKAQYDLKKMCEDAWRWQTKNPKGYE